MTGETKYTVEDLKIMQAWSLERKIQVTQTRIIEWYEKNKGKVYVSFSGGKDSTVLLDLVRRIYPDVPAVFLDTGLEYPEIREFVKTLDNVTWLRPEKSFRKVVLEDGYPVVSKEVAKVLHYAKEKPDTLSGQISLKKLDGALYCNGAKSPYNCPKYKYLLDAPFKISPICCDIMKKRPAHRYCKETGRLPILATMADESKVRTQAWKKLGCNAFDANYPRSAPMSFWTEQDVLEYIVKYNLPYATVYGKIVQNEQGKYCTTGLNRTGCMFCMFGVQYEKEPNRFQRMKKAHPQIYDYCMKPVDQGGWESQKY